MNIEQDRFLKFLLIGAIQAQVERSGETVERSGDARRSGTALGRIAGCPPVDFKGDDGTLPDRPEPICCEGSEGFVAREVTK